jgi:hypothetical protein
MTIELTPELERLVLEKAVESGMDASSYVANLLREALGANGLSEPIRRRKPISERFEEIREQAPAEVRKALDELPSDFAAEHDHYLYGAPKKYT